MYPVLWVPNYFCAFTALLYSSIFWQVISKSISIFWKISINIRRNKIFKNILVYGWTVLEVTIPTIFNQQLLSRLAIKQGFRISLDLKLKIFHLEILIPCRLRKAGGVKCGGARETREPYDIKGRTLSKGETTKNLPAFQNFKDQLLIW